jgi:hypothetical protein
MGDDPEIVWRRTTPRYEVECRLQDEWLPVNEDMLPELVEGVRHGTIPWLLVAVVIYRRLRTRRRLELGSAYVGGVMDDSDEHLRELRCWMFPDAREEASARLAELLAL